MARAMSAAPAPAPGEWWVAATKKGRPPIAQQRRKFGKVVTRVENVRGDAPALAAALKAALGTGGCVAADGAVEVQGDLSGAVEAWMVKSGRLKGLASGGGAARDGSAQAKGSAGDADGSCGRQGYASESDAAGGSEAGASHPRCKPRWSAERRAAASTSATSTTLAGMKAQGPSESFAAFGALMRGWLFWDHDYSRLPELYDKWVAQRQQPNELEATRGISAGVASEAQSTQPLDEALHGLGMLAEPCPSRQSRQERLRSRAKPAASAARSAAAAGKSMVPGCHCDGPAVSIDLTAAQRLVLGSLQLRLPPRSEVGASDCQWTAGGGSFGSSYGARRPVGLQPMPTGGGSSFGVGSQIGLQSMPAARGGSFGAGRPVGLPPMPSRGSHPTARGAGRGVGRPRPSRGGGRGVGGSRGAGGSRGGGSSRGGGGSRGAQPRRQRSSFGGDSDDDFVSDDEFKEVETESPDMSRPVDGVDLSELIARASCRSAPPAAGTATTRGGHGSSNSADAKATAAVDLGGLSEEEQLELALALSTSQSAGGGDDALWALEAEPEAVCSRGLDASASAVCGWADETQIYGSRWQEELEARLAVQHQRWLSTSGKGAAKEADRAPRQLHVSCEELWGDLDEEEALALAIALSKEHNSSSGSNDDDDSASDPADLWRVPTDLEFPGPRADLPETAHFEPYRGVGHRRPSSCTAETAARPDGLPVGLEAGRNTAAGGARCAAVGATAAAHGKSHDPVYLANTSGSRAGCNTAEAALELNGMDEETALQIALRMSAAEADGPSSPRPVAGWCGATPGSTRYGTERAARASPEGTLETWAARRLSELLVEDEAVDPYVLLDYVSSMSSDQEVLEYVEEFLGPPARSFAVEFCHRRALRERSPPLQAALQGGGRGRRF